MTGTDLTIIQAEIAAIENDIRVNRTAYFRDQAKQDRYESLLRVREANGSGGSMPTPANDDELRANSADEARTFFGETPAGRRLLQVWGGNFAGNLQAAQAAAGEIMAGMSAPERGEIMAAVDDLSPEAFTALMNKLARRGR